MNLIKDMLKSKSNIFIIVILIVNILLLYKCYVKNIDEKKSKLRFYENGATESIDKYYLKSKKFEKELNLVLYINEYSCGICNNYVLWSFKNISEKYPDYTTLFISGGEKYYKTIITNLEFNVRVEINKFKAPNNFNNPICILLDSKNKSVNELVAEFAQKDQIDIFFERALILLDLIGNKNQ